MTTMPTHRENPAPQADITVYELTCTTREPGRAALAQSTTAGARPAAAWLRALADEIDPPRPPRPTMRGAAPAAGQVGQVGQ